MIRYLYDDLVEVEPLAITAVEAVTALPNSSGKYRRTLARTLHARRQDPGKASVVLVRGEELVAAHLAARVPKRVRRAR